MGPRSSDSLPLLLLLVRRRKNLVIGIGEISSLFDIVDRGIPEELH